ncbi:MAG: glycoside hydrolase family 16 protein [Acidimicrobiia bacterium]|nr:glycoside hydrolase family 16 protein [Acidimicrobiia bacterium]
MVLRNAGEIHQLTITANGSPVRPNGTTCGGGSHPTNSTGAYIKSEIDGSNPKFAQAYGRFEIRAKLPTGAKGLWPAFWLRNGRGGWQDGEIDIFEQIGSSPSTLRSTLHWTPSDSRGHVQKVKDSTVSGLSSGFHTFQLEWTPCLMKVSVDGTVYNQWSKPLVRPIPVPHELPRAL